MAHENVIYDEGGVVGQWRNGTETTSYPYGEILDPYFRLYKKVSVIYKELKHRKQF